MKGVKQPQGYTIIEVMVVLAVSSVMFLLAAVFINGKQSRASFQQGVNEMASRLQGVINDVSDGHYSDVKLKCIQAPMGDVSPSLGGNEQGTNSYCVFLGKMLHFSLSSDLTNTQYETFSLAGARLQAPGGAPVTDLTNAHIKEITGLTTQQAVPQNLEIDGMDVIPEVGLPAPQQYALGFVQSYGALGSSNNYATGAQTVSLVYAPVASNTNATGIGGPISNTAKAQKVTICLTDGTRHAHLTIGGATGASNDANRLAVDTTQADSAVKVCT